jgi:hypothetical protein
VPGSHLPHAWVGDATVIIGPGRKVTDIYYDWARGREVEKDGALLVRPPVRSSEAAGIRGRTRGRRAGTTVRSEN